MKMNAIRSTLVISTLLALSGMTGSVGAQTLEISGGTTPWADVIEPRLADLKAAGVDIKFNGIGTGRGTLALIDGKVGVAAVGDTLEDSVGAAKKAAKSENRDITAPANLVFTKIGEDELVVIVHKSNPVTALSKAQLKDIGTGKITNWKDVGGADLPIKVVATEPSLAPGQFFKKAMMDGADYVKGTTEVRSPKEVITWVSRTPGGFGAAADVHMKAAPADAKTVKSPTMVRPMGLITVGQPTGNAKKVADLLKKN